MIKKPWTEQHRPNGLDEVIFTNLQMEKTFKKITQTGDLPNLLLHGGPGTGKTSISSALCRDLDIDTMDRLRINCSDEKIDALREKVKAFASTMPLGRSSIGDRVDHRPEFKVVQLEEFDHLSLDGQALLRSLIEDTSGSCRFIATCNYINKVIPALRSRFQEFAVMAPNKDHCLERAAIILGDQGIEAELEDIEKAVDVGYPDLRKIIQLLEQFSTSGRLVLADATGTADWKIALLGLLETGDLKTARKLVCEQATKEELVDVYRFLFDNVTKIKRLEKKWDEAVVLIAQYQFQHAFVADPELQIAALFIELGAL